MAKAINHAKHSSENAHPGIDLARATRRFLKLKEKTGAKLVFTRHELAKALGLGPKTGSASAVISALVRFGFLQRIETEYFYTDLGNKLFVTSPNSVEYKELLTKALRNPELYDWLETKYDSDTLPDEIEDILIGRYHDRNVRKENVKNIISNYLKSVVFVKDSVGKIEDETEPDEYISVSFQDSTVPIYKEYLLDAIQKTHEAELVKIKRSLGKVD